MFRPKQALQKSTCPEQRYLANITSSDAGVAQLVECQLPKLNVAGSNPVARSNQIKPLPSFYTSPIVHPGRFPARVINLEPSQE